jgi:hypothetical protein
MNNRCARVCLASFVLVVICGATSLGAPIPTVTLASGQKSPTNTEPLRFAVVFSAPVAGFAADDVLPSSGAITGCRETVPNDGSSFEIDVSSVSGDGAVCLSIPAGAATGMDGSPSLASEEPGGCVVVDRTPPLPPEILGPADSSATSAAAPKLSWAAAADASGIKNYRIVIEGPTARDTYTTRTTYSPALAEGLYTWRVNCRDPAGNTSSWTSPRALTVDRTAPPDLTLDSLSPAIGVWTRSGAIRVAACGGSDALSGTAGYEVVWTQGTTWSPTGKVDRDLGWSGETYEPLTDGEWWCHAVAVDRAGNRSDAALLGPFCIDRAPPTLAGIADVIRLPNDPGRLTATVAWVSVTAIDALDPCPTIRFSIPAGTSLPLGRSEVAVTAEDRAGNVLVRDVAVDVYNTEPPAVHILWPKDRESVPNRDGQKPTWETTSLAPIESVHTDGLRAGCLDTREPGHHEFSVTVVDVSGLSATATVRYTVLYAKRDVEFLRVAKDGTEDLLWLSTLGSVPSGEETTLRSSDWLRVRCRVDASMVRPLVSYTLVRHDPSAADPTLERIAALTDDGELYLLNLPLAPFRPGRYTLWLGFVDGTSVSFSFLLTR